MTTRDKGTTAVYAVLRVDGYLPDSVDIENRITVKEVVHEQRAAILEVDRLNRLNGHRGCVYFWQTTRLYPAGTTAGPQRGEPSIKAPGASEPEGSE
jgi:hypothetical protein